MKATIFKTGTKIAGSSIGLGKFIVNYPGGSTEMTSLRVYRKEESEGVYKAFRVNVYNAHLMYIEDDETIMYLEEKAAAYTPTTSTDSDGNVIYCYNILPSISANVYWTMRIGTGATRVEVIDIDNIDTVGIYAAGESPQEEGDLNFEQYAHLPFTTINCCYARRAYGSIDSLKRRTDIEMLYVSGSRSLYGNIENLASSALALSGIYVYDTKISGSLNTLLELMKAAGVKNKEFMAGFNLSKVTYNGSVLAGTKIFDFDANGDYTLRS